jgi:hypothetical protein
MPMVFVISELSGSIANWGMRSVCGSASTDMFRLFGPERFSLALP